MPVEVESVARMSFSEIGAGLVLREAKDLAQTTRPSGPAARCRCRSTSASSLSAFEDLVGGGDAGVLGDGAEDVARLLFVGGLHLDGVEQPAQRAIGPRPLRKPSTVLSPRMVTSPRSMYGAMALATLASLFAQVPIQASSSMFGMYRTMRARRFDGVDDVAHPRLPLADVARVGEKVLRRHAQYVTRPIGMVAQAMHEFLDDRRLAGPRFADEHDRARRRAGEDVEDGVDLLIEAKRPRQLPRLGFERHDVAELCQRIEIDKLRELNAEPVLQHRVGAVGQRVDFLADVVQRLRGRRGEFFRKTAQSVEVFFDCAGARLLDADVSILAEAGQQIGQRQKGRAGAEGMADLASDPEVFLVMQAFDELVEQGRPALGGPGGVLADVDVIVDQELFDGGVHLGPVRPILEVVAELLAHLEFGIDRQFEERLDDAALGLPAARHRRRLAFDLVRRAREGEQQRRIAAGREAQGIDERPKGFGVGLGVGHEASEFFVHRNGIISGDVRRCQLERNGLIRETRVVLLRSFVSSFHPHPPGALIR